MEQKIFRGDIYHVAKIDNIARTDSSQYDGRPAVIVSNDKCNEHSPVVEVVYLTTQPKKPMPTHVEVLCKVPSTALCEQVHSISKGRLTNYIRSCTDEELWEIDKALTTSLGLDYYIDNLERSNDAVDPAELECYKKEIAELKAELKKAGDYAAMLEKKEAEREKKEAPCTGEAIEPVFKAQIKWQDELAKVSLELATVTGERNAYKSMLENMMK